MVGRVHGAAGPRRAAGLAQVRWAFLLFSLAMAVVALPGLLLVPGMNGLWRAVHAVAVGVLVFRWLSEYRRGLSAPGWEALDAAALLLLCLHGDPLPAVGLFYGASYWRAVSPHTPRAVGAISAYGALFVAVILLSGSVPPPIAIGPAVGLVTSSLLIHLVVTTMSRHERNLRRERTFLDAVLENLDAGVVACDARGDVTLVNEAARRLHGAPVQTTSAAGLPSRYGLFAPDGVTPLTPDQVPMTRALGGEQVRNLEVVLVNETARRTVLSNARPILDEDGKALGAVLALHDVTGMKLAEAALRRQALRDPLTDLPNRLLLIDRLEHAMARDDRDRRLLALLYIDLDGFKNVNDTLGHAMGDVVLGEVATRLREAVRSSDTVARLGGDEFAVLVEDASEGELTGLPERLLARLCAPLDVGDRHLVITASLGVATSTTAATASDLLRNADLAMYAAKAAGRARWARFAPAMHEDVVRRVAMEDALDQAISLEQLRLAYQPIVHVDSGQLLGVEALLRWDSPQLGVVSPVDFIPLAEGSGFIVPLGAWVLRQACLQAQAWRRSHPAQQITVAVNLSVRQLQEPDLLATVVEALSSASLDPTALVLEITEGALMDDLDVCPVLQKLRALGISIAIDDFGTGHSSLGRLRDLPLDHVKIDKSFITEIDGPGSAPVAAATIALAHSLGLTVVAEGVEREQQVVFLRERGCEAIQGFLAGRPSDADVIDELLATGEGTAVAVPAGGRPAPAPA